MKTAVLYILYNPDIEYLKKSIIAISSDVQQIIVVDNSDIPSGNYEVIRELDKNICFLPQMKNVGIATALNVGCMKALELGYDWIMTLDQDSLPCANMLNTFESFLGKRLDERIGAVGPTYILDHSSSNEICAVDTLITSGCLLSLKAYSMVGGFKDDLFIDAVDTEFSWNLRKHGFKLYKFGNVLLEHHLGNNSFEVCFLGKRITAITNHNAMRCYYITRNSLKISREYKNVFPDEARAYSKKWIKLLIKVLLFENGKRNKLNAIIRGYMDFRKGKSGRKLF